MGTSSSRANVRRLCSFWCLFVTMFRSWLIVITVTVLAVQSCVGETSCVLWSSSGSVVQRGSKFQVYCTFNCRCQGSMHSYEDNHPKQQEHTQLNSTTIYVNVANITDRTTYSCYCDCHRALDPCGLDILAGYPPDRPEEIKCIYNILRNESGDVVCTWNRGRETYLPNNSTLRVRTGSGNHTEGPVLYNVSGKGTASPSAGFNLSRSVQQISVWVQAQNSLGSVESSVANYRLSDIVMPSVPVLGQPECSSRKCIIKVEQLVRTPHLQIQYRSESHQWTTDPDSVVQMISSLVWSVSSLEPYRLYHFRARAKFSTGLWSNWSAEVSSSTEEEAPAQALDVWFAHASDLGSMRVFWKEASVIISRGKILDYTIRLNNPNLNNTTNVSADVRSYSLPYYCDDCEVTMWARNSKGSSPPATITTHHTEDTPLLGLRVTAPNQSISISWRKPETAPSRYVLEWYPEGCKLEELRWIKLGQNETHTVITGIKPYECYEGAVYVFYDKSSATKTRLKPFATVESAPENDGSWSFEERVEGNKVTITWMALPRAQRRGCITTYTICLQNSSGHKTLYTVQAPEMTYIIKDLPPDTYSVWMNASTAKGEGPASQKTKIFIKQDTQLSFLLLCMVAVLMLLFLLCLCQSSALKQRFWVFLQFFTPRVVPDPANSKWAQDCKREQGKMIVQLSSTNTTLTESDEEANLVHVEEVFKQTGDTSVPTDISPQLPLLPNLSPDTELPRLLYLTTYIKSFSHDSDSSNNTQTSPDTNSTFDDFPLQGQGNMDNWGENEEEFFPSHNGFTELRGFGGKLTLDAVKIDCSGLLTEGCV
ncbi:interleukin-12 receptor subunit beta-2 isoform X2 [Cololabis saira]|uniref:interleukin-12 receptor subunit beta-2 isoform X2 n=1 Tax=Cololabis saira TaxID=129043 RepID=UPI002AD5184B|nr:interleukin-12 receptor subunit beta-2 isoform X2 [Cololabis saira]